MTADVRQEALAVLAELAALAPDVRLGQLMAHLGFLGEDQVEHRSGTLKTTNSWRSCSGIVGS